jgi:hypothetical protein
MATRSFIIIANPKGDYTGIYCHFDGYPSYVGRLLSAHYRTKGKARELIRLGSLSSLGERAAPINPKAHGFDNKEAGTTVAYHRDRGEDWDWCKPKTRDTVSELLATADDCWAEYVYLYWNGRWSFNELGAAIDRKPFIDLTPESIAAYQNGDC